MNVPMKVRNVCFFDSPGPKNTDSVISAVVKRAEEADIDAVVVASVSGRTAARVAERLNEGGVRMKVICVSGPPSWEKSAPQYKFPLISERERTKLSLLKVHLVNWVEEPFKQITFRNWWEKKTIEIPHLEAGLFWMTLICVGGHGFRTAVEVIFMAIEARKIQPGQRVIGVAGTNRGADSAVVMKASRFEDSVGDDPEKRMKIEEILAMPKRTIWKGYG